MITFETQNIRCYEISVYRPVGSVRVPWELIPLPAPCLPPSPSLCPTPSRYPSQAMTAPFSKDSVLPADYETSPFHELGLEDIWDGVRDPPRCCKPPPEHSSWQALDHNEYVMIDNKQFCVPCNCLSRGIKLGLSLLMVSVLLLLLPPCRLATAA